MREQRIEKLKDLLSQNSEDEFALYALGMEYLGLNQTIEAEKYFLHVLKLNPQKVPTYYQLARLYQSQNDDLRAIESLNQGILLLQDSADAKTRNEFRTLLEELTY